MKVIAFTGPSGTGKSFRAIGVAHDHLCDGIIDDGLLIEGTKILAGTSAKTEQNKVQAVKRAIFMDKKHCAEVRKALAGSNIENLLVIAPPIKWLSRSVNGLVFRSLRSMSISRILRLRGK